MSLVTALVVLKTNMVDDRSGNSHSESSSQTLFSQTEWVKFDEPGEESSRVNLLPEEKPPDGDGRYLSRLGELKTKFSVEVSFYIINFKSNQKLYSSLKPYSCSKLQN